VNTPSFLGSAGLTSGSCSGGSGTTKIEFRTRTAAGGWGAQVVVDPNCEGSSLSSPVLTRDARNHRLFIVWSQTNILHSKLSSIRFVVSANNGRTWTRAKVAVKTPRVFAPVTFSAAAAGRLWIIFEQATSNIGAAPHFSIIGYDESSALAKSGDLTARKRGSYHANLGAGSVGLYATANGLVATWQLTDAGGAIRTYIADTGLEHPALTTREQLNAPPSVSGEPVGRITFTLGANNQLYLLAEQKSTLSDTFFEWWYDFSEHRFTPLPGAATAAVLTLTGANADNLLAQYLGLGLAVDAQGDSYLLYSDFTAATAAAPSGTPSCFTGTWPCVRGIGGTQSANAVYVLQRSAGGVFSWAAVPFPFSVQQHAGDNTIEWIQPGSGLETVTTQFGGVRSLLRNGWEDVTTAGSIGGAASQYAVVLSAPLTFTPGVPTS
jgi:hypothetical protein